MDDHKAKGPVFLSPAALKNLFKPDWFIRPFLRLAVIFLL